MNYLFCWIELTTTRQPLFPCPEIHPLILSRALDALQKVSDVEDRPVQREKRLLYSKQHCYIDFPWQLWFKWYNGMSTN